MSGRKVQRINVDAAEYRRNTERLRFLDSNMSNLVEGVRREAQQNIDRATAELRMRQNSFNEQISGMRSEVREAEERTSRRLQEQADAMHQMESRHREQQRQTSNQIDRLGSAIDETREAMKEQGRALERQIANERDERRREIQSLDERISEIENNEELAREEATRLLQDAEVLGSAIDELLPHERYYPGELGDLRNQMQSTLSTARQFGQAALSEAKGIFRKLSELRVNTEYKDRERRTVQAAALEALSGLQAVINDNRVRNVAMMNNELVDVDATPDAAGLESEAMDVDYWSHGQLRELETELADLRTQIESPDETLSTEELMDVLEKAIPEFHSRARDIVQDAGANLYRQHTRLSTADIIAQTLDQNNFGISDDGWAASDDRKEFVAKFVDPAGNEIVVVVADNGIEINQFDREEQSEALRGERSQALNRALRANGVNVGAPEEISSDPAENRRDASTLIQQGVPDDLPQVATSPSPSTGQ